jgi:endonuclease/exonuclease/phosphatase family metal-dependent hydrolase
MVASTIQFHNPDLIGLQEARKEQVEDLAARMTDYAWFGVGRDDGVEAGEFMAIFYRHDRFQVQEESTFWLSETPDQPGLGWDAAYIRVVTWGRLRDLATGRSFYFLNTHFDNRGETAREKSAHQILEFLNVLEPKLPVLLTGDFNATPDSETYRLLTGEDHMSGRKQLIDAKEISESPHHGPSGTFSGFDIKSLSTALPRIDYIFVSRGTKVQRHATLSDSFDGMLPSDHLPIIVDFKLP